jgi:hypothetical protein
MCYRKERDHDRGRIRTCISYFIPQHSSMSAVVYGLVGSYPELGGRFRARFPLSKSCVLANEREKK